ncbi:predicted protein [Postia placenta Mad-698-R]|nr:predicted protein [Postia placenta Mad-698-R]
MKIDWSRVDQPEIAFQRFPSRRSQVYGTKGMVAASQPLAVEAGLEILRKGGNAADAAVAVSAALNVTEPSCCGIGGDAFCLFYDAKTQVVKAMNGSGRSPAKLSIDYVRQQGSHRDDYSGHQPQQCNRPRLRRGLGGHSRKIRQRKAQHGRSSRPRNQARRRRWKRSEQLIKNASPNADEMLLNGKAPLPGQIVQLPNLAKTFRSVAEKGKDGFYKGWVAEAIVELIQSKGGVMELDDLANHETSFVDPISYTFQNEVTLYECPPNGQGITALLALGILENMEAQGKIKSLLEMEHNSTEYLHALVEALRQYYVTDPDFAKIPVAELLSKEYLASRAKLFDPSKTNPQIVHGNPVFSSDTVYFSVTDQWGNGCSYIQSNYAAVPKGCGFTLQNRGSNFNLNPEHPNALKGGKRPYHTIIPAMATRGKELFLCYGVMGGFMQPQGHLQVLLNMLRGFTAQAALDAPRLCISAGSPDSLASGQAGDVNSEVYFEEGISPEVVQQLRSMGHDARAVTGIGRTMFGRGQVIQKIVDQSGRLVWAAGSDLRADGHAAAQI